MALVFSCVAVFIPMCCGFLKSHLSCFEILKHIRRTSFVFCCALNLNFYMPHVSFLDLCACFHMCDLVNFDNVGH